jgi:hypothetical protein
VSVCGGRSCAAGRQREEVEAWTRNVSGGREGLYCDFVDLSSGRGKCMRDVAVVPVVRAARDVSVREGEGEDGLPEDDRGT